MNLENSLKIFEGKNIRVYWDADEEKWYFSVVDIIFALTDSKDPNDYWYKLKIRVSEESKIELSTICRQLKLLSKDGKKYSTDCSDIKGIFRIVQDIPSPKVEPLKMWLAQVGSERIDETYDPEIAIKTNPKGMKETRSTVIKGATVAKEAREKIEKETGESIVSRKNVKEIRMLNS